MFHRPRCTQADDERKSGVIDARGQFYDTHNLFYKITVGVLSTDRMVRQFSPLGPIEDVRKKTEPISLDAALMWAEAKGADEDDRGPNQLGLGVWQKSV